MISSLAATSNRSFLGRMVRMPLRTIPKGTVMRVRSGPAKGLKWVTGSATHGCWLGTYEVPKQQAMARFVTSGMTVYDIGAQAGFYTLFSSRLVGEKGTVYAFEPFAENVTHLLRHVQMNQLFNVRILQAAVGGGMGLSGFSTDRGSCQNALGGGPDQVLQVPVIRLDDAVELFGLAPPQLLKIDVEGAETAVLQGAQAILARYHPVIFLAIHGRAQSAQCQELLSGAGYALHCLDGSTVVPGAHPDELYAIRSIS